MTQKLKRKLTWNEEGASNPLFQLFIIIIIILVGWHFGAPYIDGLESWTTLVRDYTAEDDPLIITYRFDIYDKITLDTVVLDEIQNMDHSFGTALYDVWNNRVEASFTDDTLGWNVVDEAAIANYMIKVYTNAPSSLFAPQWTIHITGSENPYQFWSGGYQWIEHEFKSWTINSGSGEKTYSWTLDPGSAVVSHVLGEWTYYLITIKDPGGNIMWQDNVFIW